MTAPDKSKSVTIWMADKYGMQPEAFEATLRATVIKPDKHGRVPSREEFAAFLLVAKEYGLNPLTKEFFAFTDRGGVIPIVSVDGWANLINSSPQFDGMVFEDHVDDDGHMLSITCQMYRKDRKHPVSVTEYMAECKRDTDTWRKWPRRMLRHKAMIQAARYCFGFAGIYDEDEGQRILEGQVEPPPPPSMPPEPPQAPPPPPPPPEPPAAPPPQAGDIKSLFEDLRFEIHATDNLEEIERLFADRVTPLEAVLEESGWLADFERMLRMRRAELEQ